MTAACPQAVGRHARTTEPVLVVDVETTGLRTQPKPGEVGFVPARIIELAGTVVIGDQLRHTFGTLVIPDPLSSLFTNAADMARKKAHGIHPTLVQQEGIRQARAIEKLHAWIRAVQDRHGPLHSL